MRVAARGAGRAARHFLRPPAGSLRPAVPRFRVVWETRAASRVQVTRGGPEVRGLVRRAISFIGRRRWAWLRGAATTGSPLPRSLLVAQVCVERVSGVRARVCVYCGKSFFCAGLEGHNVFEVGRGRMSARGVTRCVCGAADTSATSQRMHPLL